MIHLVLVACSGPTSGDTAGERCGHDGAFADCLEPTLTADEYVASSSLYFDTMDYTVDLEEPPPYSELVARWEWPPWLMLTAYGYDNIVNGDLLLQLFPSIVVERDCRFFEQNPFGRCRVTFYYDAHEGLGCPIYEEFTFNDAGEITWIEAWSDQPGMLPSADDDPWSEGDSTRLATRIPGLGNAEGRIDLDSSWMQDAAADDADVADFVHRASDWGATWLEELGASDDSMWSIGCGW